MKVVFTRHALERIRERNIVKTIIVTAINKPDRIELDKNDKNKISYFKRIKTNLFLKIVTAKEKETTRIITCYPIAEKRVKKSS